jgi:hypothetical protein
MAALWSNIQALAQNKDKINAYKDQVTRAGVLLPIGRRWAGGVVHGDKVYAAPHGAPHMVVWTPSSNTLSASPSIDCNTIAHCFSGGCLWDRLKYSAPWTNAVHIGNEMIMIPDNQKQFLIYSFEENSWSSSVEMDGKTSGNGGGGAVVIGPKIYCISKQAQAWIIYDTSTPSNPISFTAQITLPKVYQDEEAPDASWAMGAEIGGRIFAPPFSAAHVLIYDPIADQFSTSASLASHSTLSWYGAVAFGDYLIAMFVCILHLHCPFACV